MGMHTAVKEKEPQAKRKLSSVLVPVLLVLAGLCVLLYPVVATQWNNFRQVKVAEAYSKYEQTVPAEVINKELEDALYYNDHRNASALSDPWSGTQDERSTGFQEYKKQLDAYEAMGRVVLPKANINLPIYHGTSHEVLQKGVGHLYGTDLPVGGVGKHAVMTGHTGLQNATLFDNLSKVVVGDAIYVQSAGQKMKYKVYRIDTVLPTEVDSLQRIDGQDLITLITCTPYGINSHRLLVHAERIPMDPDDEKYFEDSGFHWQWWMRAIVIGSLIVLILLILWIRHMLRRNKK